MRLSTMQLNRLSPNKAKRRLRWILLLFLICLLIPLVFLVDKVYQQFRLEMFYQYRTSAEQLVTQVNDRIGKLIEKEENRPFSDYQFYKVSESPLFKQNEISLSPLAQTNIENPIPGVIGYFQVDPNGMFNSPILPQIADSLLTQASLNIEQEELEKRLRTRDTIRSLLVQSNIIKIDASIAHNSLRSLPAKANREIGKRAEKKPSKKAKLAKAKQDISNVGSKLSELSLDDSYSRHEENESKNEPKLRSRLDSANESLKRSYAKTKKVQTSQQENILTSVNEEAGYFMQQAEQQRLLLEEDSLDNTQATQANTENELSNTQRQTLSNYVPDLEIVNVLANIDPFQFVRTEEGHLLFYRKVWREKQRFIQGFIVTEDEFLNEILTPIFRSGNFHSSSSLIAGYKGLVTKEIDFDAQKSKRTSPNTAGEPLLIYRSKITSPFDAIELVVTGREIPLGPGTSIIHALVILIFVITFIGLYSFYRIGLKQIKLAEDRLNFVSSVSHELKTPLTSILMYGEMLREGMVKDESKRKSYYDFIYYESERLSRLISNVLQLSKLGHEKTPLNSEYIALVTITNLVQSKVNTLVEKNNYALNISLEKDLENEQVLIDADGFSQIAINLIDNAIKFSSESERKEVKIGFQQDPTNEKAIYFYVRDYGQGIPKSQIKKIFELFYRAGSELTRKTPGTGIGLALVNELARAMGGRVDLLNRDPGTEFQVYLQRKPK